MHFNPLLTTPLLTLTSALPTTPRSNRMRSLTPHTSTGFALRTNLLDPTRDLTPTIQNLYLSDQRTGAGTALTSPRNLAHPLLPKQHRLQRPPQQ